MKVATMATNERWNTSLHEAGHCIAAIELGGTCNGAILTAGGGFAIVNDLYTDKHAFMTAAGTAAETLAHQHEPPAVDSFIEPNELSATIKQGDTSTLAMLCSVADIEQLPSSSVSDRRELALWAIDGREDDPDSWAGRVAFAGIVAAEIVERNARSIVDVAKSLYVAGRLTGEEIRNLLTKN